MPYRRRFLPRRGRCRNAEVSLHSMECALEQCAARCLSGSMVSERDVTAAVERTMLHHPDVRIVGMGARGIAIAFQRAIDGIDGADGIAGIGGNDVTKVEPRDDLRIRRHTSPMETAETAEIAKNIENAGTAESDENAGTVGTGEIAETGNWAEYARRWHALKPNIVHDDPRKPQEQMDLDVEWAREVAAGTREPTLRFWEWAEPAVVIGRFQSLEDEVNVHTAQDEGFHIVRRCTGGGAMFIEPGNTITYSLYAPLDFAHGMSVEESYELCDYWLVEALRALGLDVRFAGLNDIATQYGKLGGAAQRRLRAHPRRTRRDSAPRHARLRHRRGKDDPRVEHLTRENVRQSGEISGKTCRSHALSNRHGPRRGSGATGRRRRSSYNVARMVDGARLNERWHGCRQRKTQKHVGTEARRWSPRMEPTESMVLVVSTMSVRRCCTPRCSSRFRPEEARELLPYLQHAEYDKGDFIFREGDTDHRMYLLEEGRVKLIQTILRQARAAAEHPRVRRSAGRDSGVRSAWRTAYRFGGGDDQRHACGLAGT